MHLVNSTLKFLVEHRSHDLSRNFVITAGVYCKSLANFQIFTFFVPVSKYTLPNFITSYLDLKFMLNMPTINFFHYHFW